MVLNHDGVWVGLVHYDGATSRWCDTTTVRHHVLHHDAAWVGLVHHDGAKSRWCVGRFATSRWCYITMVCG